MPDLLSWSNETVKYLEPDPWDGLKLEMPAAFKAFAVPAEEKFIDVQRGRRPLSDVDSIIAEWKANGGEEARALLAKSLSEAGR